MNAHVVLLFHADPVIYIAIWLNLNANGDRLSNIAIPHIPDTFHLSYNSLTPNIKRDIISNGFYFKLKK